MAEDPMTRTMDWASVDARIGDESEYWLVTVRPDNRPHAVPLWAVWVGGVLYISTFRGAQKVRNLLCHPRALVHLDSGTDVTIIEGAAHDERDPAALSRASAAFNAKYGARVGVEYDFVRDVSAGHLAVFAIVPDRVQAWRAGAGFEAMTWTFAGGHPIPAGRLSEAEILATEPATDLE